MVKYTITSFSILLSLSSVTTQLRSFRHFKKDSSHNGEDGVPGNSKAFDIWDCARKCLTFQQCISEFYNTVSGQYILRKISLDQRSSSVTTWRNASKVQIKNDTHNPATRRTDLNRLLIKSTRPKTKFPFYLIDLKTKRVEINRYFKPKNVCAMIYISSVNRVLMAKAHPDEIVAVSLHSEDENVLVSVRCTGFALDEEKQLVFIDSEITGQHSERRYDIAAMVINAQGLNRSQPSSFLVTNLTLIQTVSGRVTGMAADAQHSRVYACVLSKMISFRYDGKDQRTVTSRERGIFRDVIVDEVGSSLYFEYCNKLKKMYLSTNTTITLQTIAPLGIFEMIRRDKILYIIPVLTGNAVYVYNETDNTYRKFVKTFSYPSAMCLIP